MTDWPRKHKWWTDAARLYLGLITRAEATKRGVPRMTLPKYKAELAELKAFSEWVHWYNSGRKGPRPKFDLPVPNWAWLVEAEFHKKHPHPPPAPPPAPEARDNPPSRWKDAPWTKKFVAISHGLRNVDPVWTIDQLIGQAKRAGCGAIFAQIGDDTPDPDWAQHCRQLYQAGHQAGLQVGAWGRVDYIGWDKIKAMIDQVLPLDGFKADVEERCVDQLLPEHLVDAFPNLPLAVVATGGIDDAFGNGAIESAKRFGDNFDFVGQDYAKGDNPVWPDRAENYVWWRSTAKVAGGYRHLPDAQGRWHVPMVMSNAEGCPPLEAYRQSLQSFTPHYGVWDGEILEGHDEWGVFASI